MEYNQWVNKLLNEDNDYEEAMVKLHDETTNAAQSEQNTNVCRVI